MSLDIGEGQALMEVDEGSDGGAQRFLAEVPSAIRVWPTAIPEARAIVLRPRLVASGMSTATDRRIRPVLPFPAHSVVPLLDLRCSGHARGRWVHRHWSGLSRQSW